MSILYHDDTFILLSNGNDESDNVDVVAIATMSLVIIVGLSSIVVIVILLCGMLCIEW